MTEYASLREKIAAEKAERLARYDAYEEAFSRAVSEGLQAGYDVMPTPMIVSGYEHQPVMDGVCGFAWVTVRPGNSAFARWLVKTGRGRSAYGGGVQVWISAHQQSYTRKYAHAMRMANVLMDSGVVGNARITYDGRLD
jgi:hypothetical protein